MIKNMINNKKILVIAESIDINDSSGTKGRVALISNLYKVGYNVTVLHYTRRAIIIEGVKCIPIKELKFNLFYLLSRVRRLTLRFINVDLFKWVEYKFGFSFGFYNDSKSIAKGIRAQANDYNLILTLSKGTSFRPHHAMLSLHELYNKWIAYIHDPYPYHFFPEPYNWKEPGYKQNGNIITYLI
jgi:hypothetical protein